MEVVLLPIILIGGLLFVAIPFAIVLLVLKGKGSNGRDRAAAHDETATIQEINRGLNRLEKRIETLETLLIERERRKEKVDR